MHARPGEPLNLRALMMRTANDLRQSELSDALEAMALQGTLIKDARGNLFITTSTCEMPDSEDIRHRLVQVLSSLRLRAGDVAHYQNLNLRLQPDLRAEEIQTGIASMVSDGLFRDDPGRGLVVTQEGHDLFGG